jgi:hypothetical protein
MKNSMLKVQLFFLVAIVVPLDGFSQERPIGRFLQDSIKIGEHAAYSFIFTHRNLEVVFPDSNYNYYPFEFIRKEFFPTRSVGQYAIDSAIYYLTTFDLDLAQPLGLPVFILENGDSTVVFAQRDTIYIQETVLAIPDSIALKDTSFYREVQTATNYPFIVLALVLVFFIIGAVLILFGNKIKRRYLLYRLKKKHQKFIQRMNLMLGQMNGDPSHQVGMIVFEWKKYLEMLENKPFTKLTTKEIIKINPDQSLENTLKSLDRSLYGNKQDDHIKDWILYLMDYSFDRYKKRVEEVKHG